jgi:hypothetical protein
MNTIEYNRILDNNIISIFTNEYYSYIIVDI